MSQLLGGTGVADRLLQQLATTTTTIPRTVYNHLTFANSSEIKKSTRPVRFSLKAHNMYHGDSYKCLSLDIKIIALMRTTKYKLNCFSTYLYFIAHIEFLNGSHCCPLLIVLLPCHCRNRHIYIYTCAHGETFLSSAVAHTIGRFLQRHIHAPDEISPFVH